MGFTNIMTPQNKAVSGFHILIILSIVDGSFTLEESMVADKYISKHFPDDFSFEEETKFLKLLKPADYFFHFKECMDQFYSKSSLKDRAEFVKYAVEMVNADRKITSEENIYLNELLTGWEPEHAG
ncbi:hypothetical protein BH11BAC1_BH11BAC1_04640 [soil metagenome]